MLKKVLFIYTIIILAANISFAQALNYPLGARAIAMGHTGLTNKDIWGVYNNQAAIAYLSGFQLGIFAENRYLAEGMKRIAVAAVQKLGKGALFTGIDHFGDPYYSEMKAGTGYTMQLGRRFAAGIQLDYLRLGIGEGYGSFHAFTFEGGLLLMITEKLSLGIHCFNPLHARWSGTDEPIPVILRGGLGFCPEKSIFICVEILKSTANAAVISAGCEYRYREKFFFRAGISSGAAILSFGAGIKIKKLAIDIASTLHSYLGFSPHISLTYTSKP